MYRQKKIVTCCMGQQHLMKHETNACCCVCYLQVLFFNYMNFVSSVMWSLPPAMAQVSARPTAASHPYVKNQLRSVFLSGRYPREVSNLHLLDVIN